MNVLKKSNKDFWIILNRLHLFSHHKILRPSPWLSARLAHDITHKNVKPDLWRCCWKPAVCPPTSPLAQSSYRQNVKSSDWSMFQWYLKSFKQILMILVYWDYLCKDNRDMKFSYHPVFNHNGCTLTSISTAFAAKGCPTIRWSCQYVNRVHSQFYGKFRKSVSWGDTRSLVKADMSYSLWHFHCFLFSFSFLEHFRVLL